MFALTVLYDPECGLCKRAHEWLAEQSKIIELNFVPVLPRKHDSAIHNSITI